MTTAGIGITSLDDEADEQDSEAVDPDFAISSAFLDRMKKGQNNALVAPTRPPTDTTSMALVLYRPPLIPSTCEHKEENNEGIGGQDDAAELSITEEDAMDVDLDQ
jgi:hypothetical protein